MDETPKFDFKSLLKNKWVWAIVGIVAFLAWYLNRGQASTYSQPADTSALVKPAAGGAYTGLVASGSGETSGITMQSQLDKFGQLNETNTQLKNMTQSYLTEIGLGEAINTERARLTSIESAKSQLNQAAQQRKDTTKETQTLNQLLKLADSNVDIGYGSLDTTKLSEAEKEKVRQTNAQLKSNEGFRNAEIERAQNVIAQRKAQNIDTSQQEAYLSKLQKMGG